VSPVLGSRRGVDENTMGSEVVLTEQSSKLNVQWRSVRDGEVATRVLRL
jgi:hypothetical protein